MGIFDLFKLKKEELRQTHQEELKQIGLDGLSLTNAELVMQIHRRTKELVKIEVAAYELYNLHYGDTVENDIPTNEEWIKAWSNLGIALGRENSESKMEGKQ